MLSILRPHAGSTNAKIAAIALAVSALATIILTHRAEPLSPLRILSLALMTFALWAFCDEMGLRKPLNRAAFVCFSFSVGSKFGTILGVASGMDGRYLLAYSALLMASMLFWSVAFLHRPAIPKTLGAIGVGASLATILIVVVGHVVIGVAALFGLQSLLGASAGAASNDLTFVNFVERLFAAWSGVAAWLLWRGYTSDGASRLSEDGH